MTEAQWRRQARRNYRAFLMASVIAGITAVIAWWGWLR